MNIRNPGPHLSVEDIKRFEDRFLIVVPANVAWFLENVANGGSPRPEIAVHIVGLEGEDLMPIDALYGIGHSSTACNLETYMGFDTYRRILPSVFPIAFDPCGGIFVVMMTGPNTDQVRFSPSEEWLSPEVEEPEYYFVATNIREFARMLGWNEGDPASTTPSAT